MSMLRRPFDARPAVPWLLGIVARAVAVSTRGFRRRAAVLDEGTMPAWQLRDLGFRDGREVVPRRDRGI